MNCDECRDSLVEYVEHLLGDADCMSLERHLTDCATCQAEVAAVRNVMGALAVDAKRGPAVSLRSAVMERIVRDQALEIRRLKMRRRIRILGISGAMAAAVAGVLLGSFWFAQPAVAEKAPAEVMAQGAEAVPHPKTVHIVAKMRTIGHDNFSMIGAQYDFVPVEIWKQFDETPKWRVEKPGRVAVVDGVSTTMLIRPDYVVRFPKPSRAAFDTGCLLALANVQDMITHELRAAQARGWNMRLTHETTAAGDKQLLVSVEAKSGLPAGDYLQNAFFEYADMRRLYRFDAASTRLVGFEAYLQRPAGDSLIFSIERIEYDKPFDQALFALKLPNKINVYQEPQPLPDNEKYEKMTPEQAARAFFEACARSDWNEVRKFETHDISDAQKQYLGGLQLIRLGTPFQSAMSLLNGDWFVPYEIKLQDGSVKKWNLALRPHKAAKRFIIDGGI